MAEISTNQELPVLCMFITGTDRFDKKKKKKLNWDKSLHMTHEAFRYSESCL